MQMVPEQREIVELKAKWMRSMGMVWTRNGGGLGQRGSKNGCAGALRGVRASPRHQHCGNGPLPMVQSSLFLRIFSIPLGQYWKHVNYVVGCHALWFRTLEISKVRVVVVVHD